MKFCTTSSINIFHPSFSRSAWELGNWFVLKPGFHPPCARLSSYTIKLKRKKQSLSVLPLCSNTQKHPGKKQDFRIKLQAGGCPFSFPAAAMPPQRQFLSPAPCRLTALRHWCWEPWHSLQRMLPHCSHTCYNHTGRDCLCLQFPNPKRFSFRACSISWNLFWLGPWLFPPLCSFGVSCCSHSPTHRPAQTSSLSFFSLPPRTLQGLVLWNMLITETFHVSVTRHHTWVYLGQAVIWHDSSKQYKGEEINTILWRKLWGLVQIWAFKKPG